MVRPAPTDARQQQTFERPVACAPSHPGGQRTALCAARHLAAGLAFVWLAISAFAAVVCWVVLAAFRLKGALAPAWMATAETWSVNATLCGLGGFWLLLFIDHLVED